MKRIYAYLVILLTLFSQPVHSYTSENTKLISDYQKPETQNSKTAYLGNKMLQSNLEEKSQNINQEVNSILPNLELDTLKIEKGRKFVVVSDRNLESTSVSGLPVKFESIQKEYLTFDKEPSKIVFEGKVEKTGKPRLAGKSGTIKIKLEKITIDKITYPVSALISKIDNKAVYFNTLSAAPIYIANLADAASNGTINSDLKDPCINHSCTTGKNYTRPIIYLTAAALQTADLLLSPLTSLFKKGTSVTIPEKTYFEIKLNKDMYVLNI